MGKISAMSLERIDYLLPQAELTTRQVQFMTNGHAPWWSFTGIWCCLFGSVADSVVSSVLHFFHSASSHERFSHFPRPTSGRHFSSHLRWNHKNDAQRQIKVKVIYHWPPSLRIDKHVWIWQYSAFDQRWRLIKDGIKALTSGSIFDRAHAVL